MQKESLKVRLNIYIKNQDGQTVSLDRITELCRLWGYKSSNAERRLRHSDSPNIESVWNEKKTAIIGYRYKMTQNSAPQAEQKYFKVSTPVCCGNKIKGLKEHSKDCLVYKASKLTFKQMDNALF